MNALEDEEYFAYLLEKALFRAKIFHLLAWLFSYPEKEDASKPSFRIVIQSYKSYFLSKTKNDSYILKKITQLSNSIESLPQEEAIHLLRIEYTRLFVARKNSVCPYGSKWVRNKTLASQKYGEEYAIAQYYNQVGLANREGINERVDHIVSELDFMFYVSHEEALSWKAGKREDAQRWKEVHDEFLDNHFRQFAEGFSHAVQRNSSVEFYLLAADILAWSVEASS